MNIARVTEGERGGKMPSSLLGKKRERKREQNEWAGERGKKKKPSSFPSLRERSETPGALDRRALGITGDTRCPVPSFSFGRHYRLPAFWLPHFYMTPVVKNRGGRTRDSIIWEATFRSQSNKPSKLPVKTVFKFKIILIPV